MIKLMALDIDSTLTARDGSISAENVCAINRALAQGIEVVLASARPPRGVDDVARLFERAVFRVSYGGAVIRTPEGEEVRRLYVDMDVASAVAALADNHKFTLTLTVDDIEYHTQNQSREAAVPHFSVESAADVLAHGVPPLLIQALGHDASSQIYDLCSRCFFTRAFTPRHFRADGTLDSLIVLHPRAQKGLAIASICTALCVWSDEVLAIGDSEIDLSMFSVAGTSVAVANAIPSVIAAATAIAPPADKNGVAWALQRVLGWN